MTIKKYLETTAKILADKNIKSSSLDAELLLLHILNLSKNKPKSFRNDRTWLFAHNDEKLSKQQENLFLKLIDRRAKFEPVAYIVGKKEFYGLDFCVDKNVLIPRPETEIMIDESLKDIVAESVIKNNITIADIGTGSGAIAVSLAKALARKNIIKNSKIYATDISAKALEIAKKNAKKNNCDKNIIFRKGNLLNALSKNTKIDYLLANLPYLNINKYRELLEKKIIPVYRLETEYEPKKALIAGSEGLKCFIELFHQSPEYLAKNAKIYLESDPRQVSAIKKLAKKYLPKHKITVIKDLRGLNRITKIEIT